VIHRRLDRANDVRAAAFALASLALAARASAQGGALPPPPPPPLGNPTTPEKVELGRLLFWDEQLSSTRTMACATCHVPEAGGSDPRSDPALAGNVHPGFDALFGTPDDVHGSPGVVRNDANGAFVRSATFGLQPQVTGRKAPSAINAAYAPVLFWDGRATGTFRDPETNAIVFNQAAALESQSVGPIVNDAEMASIARTWAQVVQRVVEADPLALSPAVPAGVAAFVAGRGYPEIFAQVFGTPDVTPVRIAMAIAAYERTLFSNQTPFDLFNPQTNPGVLTPLEQQGAALFASPQTNCVNCHAGALLTNQTFQYIGVRPSFEDIGREAVTGNPADRGRMRVPSLRNVELRAPYFHDGSAATLEEVVDFYDRGGDFNAPNKNPLIRPLGLTQGQKNALVAFLRRPLTDPRVASAQGPFEHPALYAGSPLAPQLFGVATPGSGGFAPRIVALSPPKLGNPEFTLGIERGLGGAPAGFFLDVAASAGTPFGGSTMYLARSALVIRRTGLLLGSGPGDGWDSLVLDLPSDPSLAGTQLYGQGFVRDNGFGNTYAATEAFAVTYY
jgi:cytochrome c peroxidase